MNESKMRKKLQLNKDTVKTLTSAEMNKVFGAGLFETQPDLIQSNAAGSCTNCSDACPPSANGPCSNESVCLCSGHATCQ